MSESSLSRCGILNYGTLITATDTYLSFLRDLVRVPVDPQTRAVHTMSWTSLTVLVSVHL